MAKVIARESSKLVVEFTRDEVRSIGIILTRPEYGYCDPTKTEEIEKTLAQVLARHEKAAKVVVEHFEKLTTVRDVLKRVEEVLAAGREIVNT